MNYLGIVLYTVDVNNAARAPSYARRLGEKAKLLSRRQIWDTGRDSIVADELVHSLATISCLRRDLPRDVINNKIIYYRRDAQHKREDASGASTATDFEPPVHSELASVDDEYRRPSMPCIVG